MNKSLFMIKKNNNNKFKLLYILNLTYIKIILTYIIYLLFKFLSSL